MQLTRLGLWFLFPLLGIHGYLYTHGVKLPAYFLLYAPYLLIIALYYLAQPKIKLSASFPIAKLLLKGTFYILLILLIWASFRSIPQDWHSPLHFLAQVLFIVILLFFFHIYFDAEADRSRPSRVWIDMGIGIISVLILNLIAYYILGLRSTYSEAYTWKLATRISFLESRIEFPLAFNTREFSQTASLLVILSAYYYRAKLLSASPLKRLSIVTLFIGIAVFTIILADARITLIMTVLAFCFFLVIRRFRFQSTLTIGLAVLFLSAPLWYFLILLYVNQYTAIEIFESDFWTINNRLYVWASTIPEILGRSASELLIGSGYYSQAVTGMSENYEMVFTNWIDTERISYHNAALQMIFDTGALGLFIYCAFLVTLIMVMLRQTENTANKQSNDSIFVGLAALIFFLGVGTTEAITPLYYNSYLILIIILKSYFDFSYHSEDTQGEQ